LERIIFLNIKIKIKKKLFSKLAML